MAQEIRRKNGQPKKSERNQISEERSEMCHFDIAIWPSSCRQAARPSYVNLRLPSMHRSQNRSSNFPNLDLLTFLKSISMSLQLSKWFSFQNILNETSFFLWGIIPSRSNLKICQCKLDLDLIFTFDLKPKSVNWSFTSNEWLLQIIFYHWCQWTKTGAEVKNGWL